MSDSASSDFLAFFAFGAGGLAGVASKLDTDDFPFLFLLWGSSVYIKQ